MEDELVAEEVVAVVVDVAVDDEEVDGFDTVVVLVVLVLALEDEFAVLAIPLLEDDRF